jgi:hypothetical protein
VVGIAVLQSQLWSLTSPSRATSRYLGTWVLEYLGTWVLGYVPTCCIASVSATATPKVTVQKSRSVWRRARLCRVDCALKHQGDRVPTSPRHVGLGALHLGNRLRSSGRATDDPPSCLHLTTTLPSIIHHTMAVPTHHGCPPRHVALHDRILLHASLTAISTP